MPGISTHIAFSRLLLLRLGKAVEPYHFLLGTIAPDTFDRNEDGSFQLHHFAGPNGESDLEKLRNIAGEIRRHGGQNQISFVDGYFAHLWLDNHARLHEDALEVKNQASLRGNDLRQAVRACIEYHDLSIIGDFLKELIPQSVILVSAPGLEFVSIERAEKLLQQAMELRQDDAPARMIDGEKYREFLETAAGKFAGSTR